MFGSTFELITQAASNSIFVFCFCNLIIAMILIASNSKQGHNCNQDRQVPISIVTNTCTNGKHAAVKHLFGGNKMVLEDSRVSNAQETPMAKDKGSDNCDDYKKDNENDEFRRRVEEFIDKVNRGWKAESLRTSYVV
ncbi:uncharacterized protein LOC125369726 [Ricinus communis]|uniref:uncharacterized protein LOC125369726 n=1 Tax=Ricinus communis TaxID=3988 RepID=UPI00201A68B0|nr:uncharacterized protein LOC125369726 [Ricinus communis]